MRALCLRQVNFLAGRIREEQADECVAEDGGDLVNGAVEGGVAIAHERSPWKTTHDDLRLAVDTSSGGFDRLGFVPCPLTIYAARVRVVRPEAGHVWPAVNPLRFPGGDGENGPAVTATGAHIWTAMANAETNGDTENARNHGQLGSWGNGYAVNKLRGKRCREWIWLLR